MTFQEALDEVIGESGGRVGNLYQGIGPTVGITPKGVMERIRDLERAQREDAREGRRRKAAAIGAAHRLAGGLGSFQGVHGGAVMADILQEAGGGAIGAAQSARIAAAEGENLRNVFGAARAGAGAGAEQGLAHAVIGMIGSAGPVGQAIAGAAVAGPLGKAMVEMVLRFMSQKGLDLNRDWQFIIENQVQSPAHARGS